MSKISWALKFINLVAWIVNFPYGVSGKNGR